MITKKRARWSIVPLGLVIAACLLTFLPEEVGEQAQAAPPTSGVHLGFPPNELIGGGPSPRWSTTTASGHTVKAKLNVHTDYKAIEILWSFTDPITFKPAAARQIITLPYWPTDAIGLSDVEIAVGGKMSRGATVIETVEISTPTLVFDIATGDPTLIPSAVGDRAYVYLESTIGRDMVVWLRNMKYDTSNMLIHFHDSGDVYRLNLATEVLTLQASATPVTGVPYVPELAGTYDEVWGGDNIALGYVYVLNEYGSPDSVVLIDSNRDGDVDSHVVVADSATWASMGLSDAGNYSDW